MLLWVGLAACTSLEPTMPVGNTDFQANQKTLLAHQAWSLKGRLSVKQGKQPDTVSINWQQQARDFDITLRGTLGIGSTRVYGSDHGLTVAKSGEQPVQLANLEMLSRNYLSFEFPADNLLYWVRGLPVPGIAATTEFDANSRLSSLSQRDSKGRVWLLTFDRYAQVQDAVLPGRIKLATDDVQLTFLVDQWQLNAAKP
jgi:outer membrane lipoprotein LolB